MRRKKCGMKRILLLLLVLLLLGAGAYRFWTLHNAPPAQATAANTDARALTDAEQAAFLPLVCGGASAGSGRYAYDCTSLPGYPPADLAGLPGMEITLTSVIYGHITDATADEAYVSYQGDFESHANDFGGGILFGADGKGVWTPQKWFPGGVMDGCLPLNPQGKAQMLCLRGFTGQGELDTTLGVWVVPDTGDDHPILAASDLRGTMDPEANCAQRKAASQDVLLSVDSITRSGTGYAAQVEYVPAAVADAACKAKNFANAPVSKTTLALSWDGSAMHITPIFNFAAAEGE
jgi:hypothetical protein